MGWQLILYDSSKMLLSIILFTIYQNYIENMKILIVMASHICNYKFVEPRKHLFLTFISEANCVFPNSLQGSWRGLDDNKLTFTADELTGFKLNIPHLSESDFMCIRSFVEGDTTKYILRYGIENTIYICTLFDLTFLFNITSSYS